METWFVGGGRVYDRFLIGAFQSRQLLFKSMTETQFAQVFFDFILRGTASSLNVIVDVNCASTIHLIDKVLRKCASFRRQTVRFVLLSDFSTWGGKSYRSSITDFEAEFKNRFPLSCAQEQFRLENLLTRSAAECHIDLCVVSTGLLYGDAGLDMDDILSYLWGQEANQQNSESSTSHNVLHLECDGTAVVPLTYVNSLTNQVIDLSLCQDKWPTFIAVIDKPSSGLACPFLDTLSALDISLNGPRSLQSNNRDIRPADGAANCSSRQALWKCNIPVAVAASPEGAAEVVPSFQIEGFGPVWAEYLAAKALDPVSVLVAGPPRTGKTELAHRIADVLQVEIITIESAVKFAFSFDAKEPSEEEVLSQSYNASLWAVKAELRAAVEAKANEGKKPAKGAPAAPLADGAITEDAFSPALCQSLPVELLRKCVSAQVQLHPRCQRRGYVLDVWGGGASSPLITGAASLAGVLNALSNLNKPSLQSVQLVVELHCRASLPVDRLVAAQGAQAKAKESQAAVKALEGIVAAYNADLVPLPSSESGETDLVQHMKLGHKGVLEIVEQSSNLGDGVGATAVSRVDLSAESTPPSSSSSSSPSSPPPLSWEDGAAANALQTLLHLRGGRIGWLPTTSVAVYEHASSSEQVSSDSAERSMGSAEDAPSAALSGGGADIHLKPVVGGLGDQVKELDSVKLKALTEKADKLQLFLSSTVLPQLAENLVRIQREQPADPIMFLAEQLARCSAEKNQHAQERAYARFTELLQQGEF